jgi:hypothetical protein
LHYPSETLRHKTRHKQVFGINYRSAFEPVFRIRIHYSDPEPGF